MAMGTADTGDIASRRQLSDSHLSISATENGPHSVDRLSGEIENPHADLLLRLTADGQLASSIAC